MRASSSLDRARDGACGQVLLSSGRGKALVFACMHHSSAVLSMCDFIKFTAGRVKGGKFSARPVNACMNEANFVQRSTVRSKTSYNIPFLAIVVGMFSVYRYGAVFISSSILAVPVMKNVEMAFSTAYSVALWECLAHFHLIACATMRRSCSLRSRLDSVSEFGATGANCGRNARD